MVVDELDKELLKGESKKLYWEGKHQSVKADLLWLKCYNTKLGDFGSMEDYTIVLGELDGLDGKNIRWDKIQ